MHFPEPDPTAGLASGSCFPALQCSPEHRACPNARTVGHSVPPVESLPCTGDAPAGSRGACGRRHHLRRCPRLGGGRAGGTLGAGARGGGGGGHGDRDGSYACTGKESRGHQAACLWVRASFSCKLLQTNLLQLEVAIFSNLPGTRRSTCLLSRLTSMFDHVFNSQNNSQNTRHSVHRPSRKWLCWFQRLRLLPLLQLGHHKLAGLPRTAQHAAVGPA